ncbi:TonB-dependent receptor [Fontisphaera persica]|uniref:TonB-dependent receptor domain-containing protein n=1 Tax=Fontisphaera persica TaxID=2974023 RepID=UPI0024BF9E91|nr:TonB-dependent receptor [Fontisphaera persica]WCJ58059.1 TonB-dependent receptor [Fontisphaera persica]
MRNLSWLFRSLFLAVVVTCAGAVLAQEATNTSVILTIEGKVEVSRAGQDTWTPAQPNQVLNPGDRIRTGRDSRASLRLYNQSVLRLSEVTTMVIQAPPNKKSPLLDLKNGSVFMFDRGKPSDLEFRAKKASGAVRGTEFFLSTAEEGETVLVAVFDGSVDVSNEVGQVALNSGEQSLIEEGKRPEKTAVINAVNLIQWCLYYPGVLDPKELPLDGLPELAASLADYRAGHLLGALDKYPPNREPATDAERVYRAGLALAVGRVDAAEALLAKVPAASPAAPLANALRTVIQAVKFEVRAAPAAPPATASEWMAESYYYQSRSQLPSALNAARQAARLSPEFGFAVARVAELEFSFGRIAAMETQLDRALALSPRNAQAHVLRGFAHAARGRIPQAQVCFEQAIALDGALGNAWLGRGLCRIRQGQTAAGLEDLQTAAALEPQRSLLRSYLGKAYSHGRDTRQAAHELTLARKLDAGDPTPVFYRALLNRQENKLNAAVRDLEESIRLNDNRSVYRSRLLLDQDRAVRSANLAGIYQDAGLTEVALREAFKAVYSDYGNYSAHLFLANSYDALRDPRGTVLRYETPWLSEYLLANLLSPANAGVLSQQISQNEYSRLFDRDRVGFVSLTEYASNGDWLQGAAQYGVIGGTAWSLETLYRAENGYGAPNRDLEHLTVSLKVKQQITQQDGLYFQAVYFDGAMGDVSQRYDPFTTHRTFRLKDNQEPLLMAGYHREWSPGNHTLLLVTRLHDHLRVSNPAQRTMILDYSFAPLAGVIPVGFVQELDERSEIYTAELQQILQRERHNTIFGGRLQVGEFDVTSRQRNPTVFPGFFTPGFAANQSVSVDLNRFGAYAYHSWEIARPLTLIGGIAYDHFQYPVNLRLSPISARTESVDRISPKAGFILTPYPGATLRGGYARYLGGLGFEQSFVLEPTQMAGFNQALRNLVPDALFGPTPASRGEIFGLAFEQKLPTQTYLGASGEILFSDVNRELGVFAFRGLPPFRPETTREQYDFRERTLRLYVNQLLGEEWGLGAQYRLSHADVQQRIPVIPETMSPLAAAHTRGLLHQLNLFVAFNHRCGFFSRLEGIWTQQHNQGFNPDRPGDDFWHFNAFAGYRLKRGRAEIKLGVLNLTDQDYRLNPVNTYLELPRERTFFASLFWRF